MRAVPAGRAILTKPALTGAAPARSEQDARAADRLAGWMSVDFFLDVVGLVRGRRDHLDALLLSVIVQANLAEIDRRADLQLAFAGAGEPPPDDLRRPVTMHALSESLRQPFETVRRRIHRLLEQGEVERRPEGLIVPARALSSPECLRTAALVCERLRRFYEDLADRELLAPLPGATVVLGRATVPIRVAARLVSDHMLRVVERAVTPLGDLVDGLIVLEVYRCTFEGLLAPSEVEGRDLFLPDHPCGPVSVNRVAGRLGLPHETARRRINSLIERGICRRVGRGLIALPKDFAEAHFDAPRRARAASVQRLFAGLSQLGVLELWNVERADPGRARLSPS
jgi:DNA-binding Lrp family transcriptional regulator